VHKQLCGQPFFELGDGTVFEEENKAMDGLLDEEMNPKPAYEVVGKLINHDWNTNEILRTDSHI
jgi:hypothetical protein